MPRRLVGPSTDINSCLLRLTIHKAMQDGRSQGYLDGIVSSDGNTLMGSRLVQKQITGSPRINRVLVPRHYIVRTNVVDCIFIDGIETRADGEQVWENYCGIGNLGLAVDTRPCDRFFSLAAQVVMNNVASLGFSRPVSISGYSYGGGVADHLQGLYFTQFGNGERSTLTTFGKPKSSSRPTASNNYFTDWRNWLLSDDPVPALPPALSFLSTVGVGLGTVALGNLSTFYVEQNALQISMDGLIFGNGVPTSIGSDFAAALQAWLSAASIGLTTSHSLSTYIARFALAGARLDPAELPYEPDTGSGGMGGGGDYDAVNDRTPPILQDPATAADLRTVETTVYRSLASTINARSNTQPIIPDDRLWHAVRRGRTWYVTFNGQTVIAAPHRRGARSLAASGNELMRKIQVKAAIDPNRLLQAFTDYLAAAAIQGEGFAPPATNIPISN